MRYKLPSLILLPLLFSFSFSDVSLFELGRIIYKKHCSTCHGKDRIGLTAPPLIPQFLKGKSEDYLFRVVKNGIPASQMPAFPNLSDTEIKAIITYIKTPVKVKYTFEDIKKSFTLLKGKRKNYEIKNLKNLTVAVDKIGKILILEGTKVLDTFKFKNVHGGVKFSIKNHKFYVPARDGWIISYDFKEKRPFSKVRACVYLRNITLTPDENYLIAGCVLPESIVILDASLKPVKRINVAGRISAVYQLSRYNAVLVAYRDRAYLGFLKGGNLREKKIDIPLEDFFIDPFENFVVGTSRKENKLVVYRLSDTKKVFSSNLKSMPHLFSASFWYRYGDFYFATRHVDGSLSIWKMYNWKKVKEIKTEFKGFFVRTHYKNSYLWLDSFSNVLGLLNKKSLKLEEKKTKYEKITHVEFSGDGKLAYLSVLGKNSGIYVLDAYSLREVKRIPAKHPVGKYNILLKTRKFYPALLGYEVFMEKCWGCHHITREAFGPPLKSVAEKRPISLIMAQIVNPQRTYKILGYKRNAMPRINLNPYELEALKAFIEVVKNGWID